MAAPPAAYPSLGINTTTAVGTSTIHSTPRATGVKVGGANGAISNDTPEGAKSGPMTSPLLRLPRELREEIYSYVVEPGNIGVSDYTDYVLSQDFSPGSFQPSFLPQICNVNKQLRTEAAACYIRSRIFVVLSAVPFMKWIEYLGDEGLAALRNLHIGDIFGKQHNTIQEILHFAARLPNLRAISPVFVLEARLVAMPLEEVFEELQLSKMFDCKRLDHVDLICRYRGSFLERAGMRTTPGILRAEDMVAGLMGCLERGFKNQGMKTHVEISRICIEYV
ncbi:hypothetical protein BU16DRAFT_541409 [Lophium mytilinum]|uniref:F-box domain-containing protein n=1 Tax=Lophium mytilinum TaxID=390894 RepID=A0A6A6QK41_9PEZI|nr:hypothetical protein BU16DRAFT_541409 [Lophium mytilinum]